jgi:hypothetical protein
VYDLERASRKRRALAVIIFFIAEDREEFGEGGHEILELSR